MSTGMANDKQGLENDRIEAFLKSGTGFWICAGIGITIVLGAFGTTIVGWFQ